VAALNLSLVVLIRRLELAAIKTLTLVEVGEAVGPPALSHPVVPAALQVLSLGLSLAPASLALPSGFLF